MTDRRYPGRLIAFEGLDGSGKSSQLVLAANALRDKGLAVVTTREPTDGPYGRRIRQLFSNRDAVSAAEELELFLADRRQHVQELILPALAAGKIVLTDRYYLSTAAYQGARGHDPEQILQLNEEFAPRPDLVVFLDLPVSVGLARITSGRGEIPNDFEQDNSLRKVQAVFAAISRPFLHRLDGNRPLTDVHNDVMRLILEVCPAGQGAVA